MPFRILRRIEPANPEQDEPIMIGTLAFSLAITTILSFFFALRAPWTYKGWKRAPFIRIVLLSTFLFSYIFVVAATLLLSSGLQVGNARCNAASWFCDILYCLAKFMQLYLIEKVRVVYQKDPNRLKDKFYIFNCCVAFVPLFTAAVLGIVYRVYYVEPESGRCFLGWPYKGALPELLCEIVINLYLTSIFLFAIVRLHSFKNGGTKATARLRRLAIRTMIGCCVTLAAIIANLTLNFVLKTEQVWLCYLICRADIFLCACVLFRLSASESKDTGREATNIDLSSGSSLPSSKDIQSTHCKCCANSEARGGIQFTELGLSGATTPNAPRPSDIKAIQY